MRTERIVLRVTQEEKALIKMAAECAGKSMSAFIRDAAMEYASAILHGKDHLSLPEKHKRTRGA